MSTDKLRAALASYFAVYRPNYGVEVGEISPDGHTTCLEVRLLPDHHYCCRVFGCHFGFRWDDDFQRLRAYLESLGLKLAGPIVMRVHYVVREGAYFDAKRFVPNYGEIDDGRVFDEYEGSEEFLEANAIRVQPNAKQ